MADPVKPAPGFTIWGISAHRDSGGYCWNWPKVVVLRRSSEALPAAVLANGEISNSAFRSIDYWLRIGLVVGVQIGWRWTAWGVAITRLSLTESEAGTIIAVTEDPGSAANEVN